MSELSKSLGQNIRTLRKERSISQESLAHVCEIDRSYLGRIERGEVNITVCKLYEIAKALEINAKELLP